MGLESVTHISDLVVTNPVGSTDPKSQGDDHIRNIKSALKTDFPNINGVVSGTPAELNIVVGRTAALDEITGNETLLAADFDYIPLTSFISASAVVTLPAASTVSSGKKRKFYSTTTGNVTFVPNGTDTIGGANATFRLSAHDCLELTSNGTGAWIITVRPQYFVGQTIEAAIGTAPNGYACVPQDGAAISRTTYAGLFAEIGTTYGAGDGSTTFNVPNRKGRTAVGSGTGSTVEEVADANVSVANNTFTVPSNTRKWITGMSVVLTTTTTLPTGLSLATTYYIIRDSATTIKFATTLANAQNGVAIDITAVAGSGTHTVTHTFEARTLGERGGEEAHAMSSAELLAHTHNIPEVTGSASGGQPRCPNDAAAGGFNSQTTSTGGNAAMNNMQPFITMAYYIKT